jgi:hypothetical protein
VDTLRDTYSVDFTNRACSGSEIDDVRSRRQMEVRLLRASIPPGASSESDEARDIAEKVCSSPYRGDERYEVSGIAPLGFAQISFTCARSMEPQWSAISHRTDLVLLSIGGNDMGFADIVKRCFTVLRSPRVCKKHIDAAHGNLDSVRASTGSLLRGMKERMRPGAKIVFNSYAYLERDPNLTIGWKVLGVGVRYEVGREVRALGDRGERAQLEAVADVNDEAGPRIVYMDQIKSLFAGHEPDGRVTRRNRDRWIHEFDSTTRAEWYHYNSKGHAAIGGLLARYGAFGVGS